MSNQPLSEPTVQPAIPLAYEPPQPKPPGGVAGVIVLIALFVCGTSVGIFAIEVDARRYNSSAGADSWPAAIAVVALAMMGTSIAFFLTRRR